MIWFPTRHGCLRCGNRYSQMQGYISQTMKLGALGLPAYRTFSLEELEYATNKFESFAFMDEGSQGQVKEL
ncbi:hypothetical protein Bca4012_023602 [Brassica carinata]